MRASLNRSSMYLSTGMLLEPVYLSVAIIPNK
jgi:hypothetical protein